VTTQSQLIIIIIICGKRSGKEVKMQEFMFRDATNEEPEMYDYKKKLKLRGLSPHVNYTDRAAAAGRRS